MDCIYDALIICVSIDEHREVQWQNQPSQATNSEAHKPASFEYFLDAVGFNYNHCAR